MNGINIPKNMASSVSVVHVYADRASDFNDKINTIITEINSDGHSILNVDIKQPIDASNRAYIYNAFIMYAKTEDEPHHKRKGLTKGVN